MNIYSLMVLHLYDPLRCVLIRINVAVVSASYKRIHKNRQRGWSPLLLTRVVSLVADSGGATH